MAVYVWGGCWGLGAPSLSPASGQLPLLYSQCSASDPLMSVMFCFYLAPESIHWWLLLRCARGSAAAGWLAASTCSWRGVIASQLLERSQLPPAPPFAAASSVEIECGFSEGCMAPQ